MFPQIKLMCDLNLNNNIELVYINSHPSKLVTLPDYLAKIKGKSYMHLRQTVSVGYCTVPYSLNKSTTAGKTGKF
jgi:hypothetical protein